jgi:uncharacterized protein YcgI (DUF1989 family)
MLLMKEATETRAPLPMQTVTVDAASAGSILVKRGQLLRITALEDGAVASLCTCPATTLGCSATLTYWAPACAWSITAGVR